MTSPLLRQIPVIFRLDRIKRTGILSGAAAGGIGALLLFALPGIKIGFFARVAARVASLFLGTPVLRVDEGWLLPSRPEPIVVSAACSGADFWLITVVLLAWQLGRGNSSAAKTIPLALLCATPFSIAVNSIRIVAVTQAHRWFIPLWPANYAAFFHQFTGVAVFLPALILLHAFLENYRSQRVHSAH